MKISAVAAGAAMVLGGVGATGLATAATPAPTILDSAPPLDAAAYGDTVAWLRPVTTAGRNGSVIVVRDGAGAAPRALSPVVPQGTDELTIGTDAAGKLVIVLGAKHGLYFLPADGSAAPKRLKATAGGDHAPGLRKGTFSFSRTEKLRAGKRATVRVGLLTQRTSKRVWTVPGARVEVGDTAVGGPSVVVETLRPIDVGPASVAYAITPGKAPRQLLVQRRGGASDTGFGRATVSTTGKLVTIARVTDGEGGHPMDSSIMRLPSGKLVKRTKLPTLPDDAMGDPLLVASLLPLKSGGSVAVSDSGPLFLLP